MSNRETYKGTVPFITNNIVVRSFDRNTFLSLYEVFVAVRDERSESEDKYIKYEEITRPDGILSCFIGNSNQPGNPHAAHFLVSRSDALTVLTRLRSENPSLAIREYQWTDKGVWDAIRLLTLSLTLSPESDTRPQMTFSGRYYLSSPVNFGLSASRMQKVCMEIGIDGHGLLIPRTVVFTAATKDEPAKRAQFIIEEPNRMSLVTDGDRDNYIKNGHVLYEKRNPFKKKTIPWLPFANGHVHEGKNHEAFWFVRRMNRVYGDFLKLEFKVIDDYEVVSIDKKEITGNMARYVCDMLTNGRIAVTDMCNNLDSASLQQRISSCIRERYAGIVSITDEDDGVMEIQIVKPLPAPEERKDFVDNYVPATEGGIMQHISHAAAACSDSALTTIIDRLMVELAVKKSIITGRAIMHEGLADGWNFIIMQSQREKAGDSFLFRNRVGFLVSDACGSMKFDSCEFINTWGPYQNVIDRAKSIGLADTVFMMKHGGNVYMLVDTMEVPVLNQEKILIDDQKICHDTDGDTFFAYLHDKGISDDGIDKVKAALTGMVKTNKKGEAVPKYQGHVGPKILGSLIKQLPACVEKHDIVSAIESYASGMHFLARRRRPEFLEEFFGGYTNIHVWWENPDQTFCYIPSIDPATLDMKESGMIITMPHARKVTLITGSKESISSDKDIILNMLKAGIGKYGAAMAYPYPYKILKEYLNNRNRNQDFVS